MQVNAEKLDDVLHKLLKVVKETHEAVEIIKHAEVHIKALRQELLTAVGEKDEKTM